ncbi:MAG: transporter [Flavobacteriaceae bacterium TMED184]|nr:MAG: transporter [Flavobacteriaceae bacterium TMED184]
MNFWSNVANLILKNRIIILLSILGLTFFWSNQWKNIQFTYTEAKLLPDDHPESLIYDDFKNKFGEEGNLIVIAVKDSLLFSQKNFKEWNKLSQKINEYPEVNFVLSFDNIKDLVKDNDKKRFVLKEIFGNNKFDAESIQNFKEKIFYDLPFYNKLLLGNENRTVRTIIYLNTEIVNTEVRKDFILNDFIPLVYQFEKSTSLDIKVSGMPYIRTLNAQNIKDEIGLFVLTALFVTALIFFLFFRSYRATFISMLVVLIGVGWAFGVLGWLGYEITILTALIPPLIIVIGIPNCIFLINKYQQEFAKNRNKLKSLESVIIKIGNATLMTNLTTASGFATFILTNSQVLKEFGIVASLNIMAVFLLSLLIIPIAYSFSGIPNKKHLKHLENVSIKKIVKWLEDRVRKGRLKTYIISLISLILGIIGIYQIEISGSIIEDMPKKSKFFEDIKFFDNEFNGIVPLEINIDTKRRKGVNNLATIKRMNKLSDYISSIPELSSPISIINLLKYIKQAYYNGNPKYYKIPTSQENSFLSPYLKNMPETKNLITNYIDSTGQNARMTTFLMDVKTNRIEMIEEDLKKEINEIFGADKYNVILTGKALLYLKGTHYLIKNLFISLSLAILLIAMFMAYLFRSYKVIIISLIPNLLPLIVTAGVMGFTGIPLKPSTILVFSVAFGISVDNTIHFLAKYRQELIENNWKINSAVYSSIREAGVSMLYTSIVLFFGFAIFMISSFGGTVALGGLVSVTLLFAMLANLILLPSLLISLEDTVSNEKVIKEPKINIIERDKK